MTMRGLCAGAFEASAATSNRHQTSNGAHFITSTREFRSLATLHFILLLTLKRPLRIEMLGRIFAMQEVPFC